MREIKFRAWDNKAKIMREVDDIDLISKVVSSWDEGLDECVDLSYFRKECVLMQFTGLLDKTGRPIFEGDILSSFTGGQIENYLVIFEKGKFQMKNVGNLKLGNIEGIGFGEVQYFGIYEYSVIGNKFENTELLTT